MDPKITEKQWSKDFEEDIRKYWKKKYDFKFDKKTKKKIFVVDTPPPYPSGAWHIGATAAYALLDVIARSKRMQGYAVYFPWGVDRNGINIEMTVEKATGKKMHDFDREEFIKLCKQEIKKFSDEIETIAKRIGMTCDFENPYATDSDEYRAFSQAAFIQLWKQGQITEHLRPNNYCPGCRTTIADAEVYYKELPTKLYHLKFQVKGGKELIIATTRPELLAACQAVLVHPDDDRYKGLHGKTVIIPLYDREVPIKAHPYVKTEFGSGVVMICSYGDQGDVMLFRELELEPINALDEEAKLTNVTGKYKGMNVKEAREAIVKDLKKAGLIKKEEDTPHRTPTCERSKDPVEIIQLKEWYVKQLDYLDDLRKQADKMTFHPKRNKRFLIDWINTVTIDWPISRRRYYHTEIPLWYCKKCGTAHVPEPGKYYRPWKEKAPFNKCDKCGSTDFIGEEKVFDTWMDSSVTNLYIMDFYKDKKFFEANFPCSLRPQGREIVRTWLYYTMLKSHLLTKRPAFKHVWIHGMGLDEHGRKMSKSLGNVVPPEKALNEVGTDAFRFWACSETMPGDDFRISLDRMNGALKTLSKLWNVARFISMFPEKKRPKSLKKTDEWILAELNKLIKACEDGYNDFNFYIPSNGVKNFIWNLFAPNYVEMVKRRAYDGDESACFTLHTVLKTLLKILAPVTPHITCKLYADMYGGKIHSEGFDKLVKTDEALADLTERLVEFNSYVWKTKKEKGLALNAEIKGIKKLEELKPFDEDLKAMHNLK